MRLLLMCILLLGPAAWAAPGDDIFKAAKTGDCRTAEQLLHKNPRLVLQTDERGRTPLILAVDRRQMDMTYLLLRYSARFTAKSAKGTPLHIAVLNNDEPMIKLLITSSAKKDPALPKQLCNTPRDFYDEMSVSGEDGNTPLHLAARQCNTRVYNYLRANGGDENKPNGAEKTPAQLLNNCLKARAASEAYKRRQEARKREAAAAPKDDGV